MALESEFTIVTKKIHDQKNSMEDYYMEVEEISRTHKSIIQKVSGINIKLEDQSLDANELLNYTKQKESALHKCRQNFKLSHQHCYQRTTILKM